MNPLIFVVVGLVSLPGTLVFVNKHIHIRFNRKKFIIKAVRSGRAHGRRPTPQPNHIYVDMSATGNVIRLVLNLNSVALSVCVWPRRRWEWFSRRDFHTEAFLVSAYSAPMIHRLSQWQTSIWRRGYSNALLLSWCETNGRLLLLLLLPPAPPFFLLLVVVVTLLLDMLPTHPQFAERRFGQRRVLHVGRNRWYFRLLERTHTRANAHTRTHVYTETTLLTRTANRHFPLALSLRCTSF